MHVEDVAIVLRAAVHGEVLGRGVDLAVLRIVTLHRLHERDTHSRGEERIFAVGFLAAAPAGVAENVDVGRPEGEALVALALPAAGELLMLGAAFVADGGGHLRS